MRVSVISTVYNGGKFFDRAIPSIRAQTFEDFEWVIVDDGSTDFTAARLAQLQAEEPRVRVISVGRQGRTRALNMAFEHAHAEYIANQDFDDVSYPERLRLQVEFLDSHPDLGAVGGHYLLVDLNRGERYVRMPPETHPAIVHAMARNIPFAHTLVTFRKEAWQQAGGYPLLEDGLEDFRLFIALAACGWRLANLPTVLGEHYVHAESFWHREFRYRDRQRNLARAQALAIRTLNLPSWQHVYPLARHAYGYVPTSLKRVARRVLAGSRERDLA